MRPASTASIRPSIEVAALVPARNAVEFIPGYLAEVSAIADYVVALDDGSTDSTFEMLASSPLVRSVIRNPTRSSFSGWNDSKNRGLLIDAVRKHHPQWILFLDIDEMFDRDDARSLRETLCSTECPQVPLGFEVFRMMYDHSHFDKRGLWVYRLFPVRDSMILPEDSLHFEPIPECFAARTWTKTNCRIKHLNGITAPLREARYLKYCEADPELRWQGSYENLLDGPGKVRKWQARIERSIFKLDSDISG